MPSASPASSSQHLISEIDKHVTDTRSASQVIELKHLGPNLLTAIVDFLKDHSDNDNPHELLCKFVHTVCEIKKVVAPGDLCDAVAKVDKLKRKNEKLRHAMQYYRNIAVAERGEEVDRAAWEKWGITGGCQTPVQIKKEEVDSDEEGGEEEEEMEDMVGEVGEEEMEDL